MTGYNLDLNSNFEDSLGTIDKKLLQTVFDKTSKIVFSYFGVTDGIGIDVFYTDSYFYRLWINDNGITLQKNSENGFELIWSK